MYVKDVTSLGLDNKVIILHLITRTNIIVPCIFIVMTIIISSSRGIIPIPDY